MERKNNDEIRIKTIRFSKTGTGRGLNEKLSNCLKHCIYRQVKIRTCANIFLIKLQRENDANLMKYIDSEKMNLNKIFI